MDGKDGSGFQLEEILAGSEYLSKGLLTQTHC